MKRCYRVDYVGVRSSDYIWCEDDDEAIAISVQMAIKGNDYADYLDLAQVVEVDVQSGKRVVWC